MVAAKVSRRGQIVIPRPVRQRLDLREGDRVASVDNGEDIVLRPLTRTLLDLRGSVSVEGPQDFDAIRGRARESRAREEAKRGD